MGQMTAVGDLGTVHQAGFLTLPEKLRPRFFHLPKVCLDTKYMAIK